MTTRFARLASLDVPLAVERLDAHPAKQVCLMAQSVWLFAMTASSPTYRAKLVSPAMLPAPSALAD